MPLEQGTQMPSLEGATEWLNATGASAQAQAKGRPTLVHLWSVSCETCAASMSDLSALRERHAAHEGLVLIAVHVPLREADADAEIVRGAVATCGITEPCAIDNEGTLRAAFRHEQGDELPAYYLFDAGGTLVASASGGDGLKEIAPALE